MWMFVMKMNYFVSLGIFVVDALWGAININEVCIIIILNVCSCVCDLYK